MAEIVSGVSFRELPKRNIQLIANRAAPTIVPMPVKTVELGVVSSGKSTGDHLFLPAGGAGWPPCLMHALSESQRPCCGSLLSENREPFKVEYNHAVFLHIYNLLGTQ
jgi:hypothetical protein